MNRYLSGSWNLWLLVMSILCFGISFAGGLILQSNWGNSGKIAKIVSGNASVRSFGTTEFISAVKGTDLFNMDVVWVGKSQEAELEFDNSRRLKVGPKTLLILKRPFRSGLIHSDEETYRVITAGVPGSKEKEDPPPAEQQSNMESVALPPIEKSEGKKKEAITTPPVEPMPAATGSAVHPIDRATIFLIAKSRATIRFSWTDRLTGTFILEGLKTARSKRIPLKSMDSVDALVDVAEGAYRWRIEAQKTNSLGPNTIQIKTLTRSELDGLVGSGKLGDTLYVY